MAAILFFDPNMHFRLVKIVYTILIHVLPHIVMNKYSEVYFSPHYSVQPKLYLILILTKFTLNFSPKIVFFQICLSKMAAILNF